MSRNKHNLSNYTLTTTNMGKLIPINCVEALPSDTFQGNSSLLIRLGAMNSPVMHPVTARVHHFFIPSRTIVKNMAEADTPLTTLKWKDFITGGDDGLNADTLPTIATTGTAGDLFDKLGFPDV
ncbi:major capsid protein, partial [Nocardia mangyaensis]|uniref:major capsid protein n=1 Tax=Nocardia mangyaensis TaxID=2213200 RepID=UPI0026749080